MKNVYVIIENGDDSGKNFWQKIGVAFENKDGSLNVILNALPIDGRLHIRDSKSESDGEDFESSNKKKPRR